MIKNFRFAHVDVVNNKGETIRGANTKKIQQTCKVTLERYRIENHKILNIFHQFTSNVERASIDEAFLDLTDLINEKLIALQQKYKKCKINNNSNNNNNSSSNDNSSNTNTNANKNTNDTDNSTSNDNNTGINCISPELEGITLDILKKENLFWQGNILGGTFDPCDIEDVRLMIGSSICNEIRNAVHDQLGYTCSAGVSHSKKFAKLISSMNKPNGQTILATRALNNLLQTTPFRKLQGFGGKLGEQLENMFNVTTFYDITSNISLNTLNKHFGASTGEWIYLVCHGICEEEVKIVDKIKGFGSSKNLRSVSDRKELLTHLKIIASELFVRLISDRKQYNRIPKTLVLHYRTRGAQSSKRGSTSMPYIPPDSQLNLRDNKSNNNENMDSNSNSNSNGGINGSNKENSHEKYVDIIVKQVEPLLPTDTSGMQFINIGMSVSGFIDAPKSNIANFFQVKKVKNKECGQDKSEKTKTKEKGKDQEKEKDKEKSKNKNNGMKKISGRKRKGMLDNLFEMQYAQQQQQQREMDKNKNDNMNDLFIEPGSE